MQTEDLDLKDILADPKLKENYLSKFVSAILSEKLTSQELTQKIMVDNKPREVRLTLEYPNSDGNTSGLYSACVCDKSTNEAYMTFYTKEKNCFVWYITGFIMALL